MITAIFLNGSGSSLLRLAYTVRGEPVCSYDLRMSLWGGCDG